ncbi:hypothetical protein [Haloprofundus halobius]|uniref:hypothetical protein n=1 Tax=Haloprofundus halobius TaxID=2876194 RepID=UPI001CCE7180|nr:hypothetical protein [Haloprofundus halobius]
MSNTKLTDFDRSVLARLRGKRLTAAEVADRMTADVDTDTVSERLHRMADDDLVRELDGGDGAGDGSDDTVRAGRYALTESGRRVLQAPNTAAADEAIDLPPDVRRTLAESPVGVDCIETLKHAFTFLREWGEATVPELKAGVFPETSTGYRDADEWWDDCARAALAELPHIDPGDAKSAGDGDAGPFWRYVGDSIADGTVDDTNTDGRAVLRGRDGGPRYANLTHVLVTRKVTAEQRLAAAAAFDALRRRGEATTEELRAAAAEAVTETGGQPPDDRWLREELPELLGDVPSVDRRDAERWAFIGDW